MKILTHFLSALDSKEQLQKAKSIAKVARVTIAASIFCIGITIANSIAFVKMFSAMSSVRHWNNDWRFITFVSCVRLLEIAMAITLMYALSHTSMKLGKVVGLSRFTKKLQLTDPRTVRSVNNGYPDTWKSASSYSSASSARHFIE